MNESIPFKLFANCILSKGYSRSIILDIQRGEAYLIPNSLYDILQNKAYTNIESIRKDFEPKDQKTIDEYFDFLVKNELILFSENSHNFPALNLSWHTPEMISYCILDFDSLECFDYNFLIEDLDTLMCQFLQIRIYSSYDIIELESLLQKLHTTTMVGVELILPYDMTISDQKIEELCDSYNRIGQITLHSSAENKEIRTCHLSSPIRYLNKKINTVLSCGVIHPSYFSINIETFTESQHHNTCLNRKISIDAEGNIRNCPSMSKSYGNIRDTRLIDVVNNPEFQKVWHIKKDEITKCKDCEFRHICTDCRAYVENPQDIYSGPLKCGYNPYTCEWEEWSRNPLKQQAIEYYGMQELVKNNAQN